MPEAVADLGRDLDDFGAVGHGVHQLESPLVQLQRDVLLPGVASVDAQDDTLKEKGRHALSHAGCELRSPTCAILSGSARVCTEDQPFARAALVQSMYPIPNLNVSVCVKRILAVAPSLKASRSHTSGVCITDGREMSDNHL